VQMGKHMMARPSSGMGSSMGVNLETKIKMLNDVGVVKKTNPMAGMSSYFTSIDHYTDAMPVSIIIKKSDGTEADLKQG
jgi:hypothetical protein